MTSKAKPSPKVLRAHLYKAFVDKAEAEAALKQAQRDQVSLDRPVIREDHYGVSNEDAEPCTAQEYVEQFRKQLDVMAKAFPEEGEAMKNLFEKTGPAKIEGKLGRYMADQADRIQQLQEAFWQCEFDLDDRIREYRDGGEEVYEFYWDLKLSALPKEDQAKVTEALKPRGELYQSLSQCEDIPSFYVLPQGIIAYNEHPMEDGAPVRDRIEAFFDDAGISTRHLKGQPRTTQTPYGCESQVITVDGIFPAPGTAEDAEPEKWLPTLKVQVMDLFTPKTKDQDAFIEPS